MKKTILTLFFCFIGMTIYAQNLYVMRVEGKVTLAGKPLKKRDKVPRDSRLIFSDREARLHLVSAKGSYNLSGNDAGTGLKNEILLELSNDYLASYSVNHAAARSIIGYEINEPPYINYLFAPKTNLPVPTEKNYVLKAVTPDTTYRTSLISANGEISLEPHHFASYDTSLTWQVFIEGAEIDSLSIYTFKNPKWAKIESIVDSLKERANSTFRDGSDAYLALGYHHEMYANGKYFPFDLLEKLVRERIHWYHFQPNDVKFAITTPFEIVSADEDNKAKASRFYLAKMEKDTVSVQLLPRRNKTFYLNESDFELDKENAWKGKVPIFAIIKAEENNHPENAKVLHFIAPQHFIALNEVRKDIKFLSKKLELEDTQMAIDILEDFLTKEYGEPVLLPSNILKKKE